MNFAPSIPRGTQLIAGSHYRITAICPSDPDPSLQVGDVVACEAGRKRCVDPAPDDDYWFADFVGDGGYGTLVIGLVEVPNPGAT